jgi:DNA polymerase III subunit epsilon
MPLDLTQPWHDLPIVVVDTETTGIGDGHAVVEVAAVRFEQGRVVAEYATLINPERDIPEEAAAIHGITAEMVAGKPLLWEAAGALAKVAAGAVPCAFNAPFDRAFIHRAIVGTDCPVFDPSLAWLDVYVICASPRIDKYVRGKGRLKLGACCERHGVELQGAHRALGDARATGALLFRLFDKGLIKSCTAKRLLDHTTRMRAEQEADFQRWKQRQGQTEMFKEGT